MAPHFRALGWEMVVALPEEEGDGAARLSDRVQVIQLPLHRLRGSLDPRLHATYLRTIRPEVRRLSEIIEKESVDIVQVAGVMNPHGGFAARRGKRPLVWQLLGTFAPMALRRFWMPFITRTSDVIMTAGEDVARVHPGTAKLGHRWITFFPPVDTSVFAPDADRRRAARSELGVPDDGFLVGTVGNLNKTKAHERLVEAARVIRSQASNVYFRILGAETPTHAEYYENEVIGRASRYGLFDGDELRIISPGPRIPDLLPAFDAFALCSRAEGVPTSLLEAMSCGVPVVTTPVGAVTEVVDDEVTGIVTSTPAPEDLAAGLLRLVASPDLCSSMGRESREKALSTFDASVCAETHVRAFELARHHHASRGVRA